jgi:PAS domain S-box-containing protein
MLAHELDFREIFKISQTAMALLGADLTFIDANQEFLEHSGRPLEALIGRNFFEVFPKMPQDPGGQPRWVALEEAMTSGHREADHLIRYDVQDVRTGVFEERYFSTRVQPIRGADGKVEVYEVSVLEVTPIIDAFRASQAEQM